MNEHERINLIAEKVRVLRTRLAEKQKLDRQVDSDKHTIRAMLKKLGYRGPMPWEPVQPPATIVPFPEQSNESVRAGTESA